MNDNVYIWWTDQNSAELTLALMPGKGVFPSWPKYLQRKFVSRLGRNGRGRLWVDRLTLGEVDMTAAFDTDTPRFRELAEHWAGVAIHRRDLHHVLCLPGFVSDTDGNWITRAVYQGDEEPFVSTARLNAGAEVELHYQNTLAQARKDGKVK